ncbi:beta-ketoacyl synthase N-terminal-like domain-containing protein [Streptosporangium sp. NPDC004631]
MSSESFEASKEEKVNIIALAAVRAYVRRTIAQVVEREAQELDGPDALRELNMDSLTRMNITLRFAADLGDVPPTLMFEYMSVESLAEFLRRDYEHRLRNVVGDDSPISVEAAPVPNRQRVKNPDSRPSDEIAVIAVTGRYPGAPDIETLWGNLREGVSSIREVPEDRWDWRPHFDERRGRDQKSYGRWGGFIDGVADFDADFFGILPRDAVNMDPQERLFLETCWHLLEQAGQLGITTHESRTGVFFGTMNSTYGKIGAADWPMGRLDGASSAPWSIANRVSYFFDFHGPSFAVDSACSSSLTAVHLACESLRRGECRAAIAGGANLLLHPSHLVGLSMAGMLSSDGACKVFDAAADGFVPGEGVGAVLLKTLSDALADGDEIWGVIKGSAVNTAGRTSGFTVPNPVVQSDLVAAAIAQAGVDPRTITYVEAHGTGTELGDPIEIAGLSRALTVDRSEAEACAIGSIKANIGHLEGAAGVAGLTKVLLQLRHREIAPCVNLNELNPKISTGTLWFPRVLTPWVAAVEDGREAPLRAGVSSFGAGGANAHVIVEEFRSPRASGDGVAPRPVEQLILLSARSPAQLRALAVALAGSLPRRRDEPGELERLAYSTQIGRKEMAQRAAVIAHDLASLRVSLEAFAEGGETTGVFAGSGREATGRHHLFEDEEGQEFVQALLRKRRLGKLAQLWADGASIEWRQLWSAGTPGRTELPAYPFDRRRHWAFEGTASPVVRRREDVPEERSNPITGHHAMVERDMRLIACGFLLVGPGEVDVEADLMELGFDSISLVQLTARLGEMYELDIEPVVIFDHPNLAALSSYLMTEHPSAVERRYEAMLEEAGGVT